MAASVRTLSQRLAHFLLGQSAVQGVNLVAGVALLWVLPPLEYALYIVAAGLIGAGNLGTDMGTGQAVITFGSRNREDRSLHASLFSGSQVVRARLFLFAVPVLAMLGWVMMAGQAWPVSHWAPCFLAVYLSVLAQRRIPYFNALMNVRQDAAGLFATAFGPAVGRLVLTLVLCWYFPLAWMALLVNIVALAAQDWLSRRHLRAILAAHTSATRTVVHDIKRFIKPLVPGVIYVLVQGQLTILLLSVMHFTDSIAEVGALGRLGQILSLLAMLNPFFVQPTFAALRDKANIARRAAVLMGALVAFTVIVTMTAIVFPGLWLMILGPNYSHLRDLMGIAVAGPLVALIGGTLYTIVIATGRTRHQWLQIPLGIGAQAAFLALNGLSGTADAIILIYLPAVSYLLLQCALLLWVLNTHDGLKPGQHAQEIDLQAPAPP
jgi:O-antigen/teichoic acid export membrane protein